MATGNNWSSASEEDEGYCREMKIEELLSGNKLLAGCLEKFKEQDLTFVSQCLGIRNDRPILCELGITTIGQQQIFKDLVENAAAARKYDIGREIPSKRPSKKTTLPSPSVKKSTIRTYCGWKVWLAGVYSQVRGSRGGGVRKVDFDRTSTYEHILNTLRDRFLEPDDVSYAKLGNFSGKTLDREGFTLEGYANAINAHPIRIYLLTGKKTVVLKRLHHQAATRASDTWKRALLKPHDKRDVKCMEIVKQAGVDQSMDTAGIVITKVTIHRGMAMEDFIKFFLLCGEAQIGTVEVQMILEDETQESGENNSSVLRDALSEFWASFYNSLTTGNVAKVPCIVHYMTASHWRACAQVVVMGYKQVGYFPIALGLPFLISCMYGACTQIGKDDLVNCFMDFVSDKEREVLSQALIDFDATDQHELLDALSSHDVRVLPNAQNLGSIVEQIAHKSIVQAPAFISKCWGDVFTQQLAPILKGDFATIATELYPTTSKVLKLIQFPTIPGRDTDRELKEYIEKFVKSLTKDRLKMFMRLVTGSDLMIVDEINVRFVDDQVDFTRRPAARMREAVLEVPREYKSFVHFSAEFNKILDSNVWMMDMYTSVLL